MAERVLVTGASSGIGEAIVRRYAAEGARIAAVARRAERLAALKEGLEATTPARIFPHPHDLRDLSRAEAVFGRAVADLGGLDVFVGNAGVLHSMDRYEIAPEKDREMLEVNAVAAIYWTDLAARHFLAAGGGTIVGISSVAGERGRMRMSAYAASKAAYSTFLESLDYRLAPRGVRVLAVKPGFVDTPMSAGRGGLFWVISADEAARRIVEAARRRTGVLYVPRRWALVGWVMRNIPSFLLRHIPA